MGLGTSSNNGESGTFISIAGGKVWDKTKGEEHPLYGTQEFKKIDDTIGVRAGAMYDYIVGSVVGVRFNQHEKFGESVLVTVMSEGERYIVSISTNNRYSQDMLKALLKMDFSKEILMKPYDFVDKVKNNRVQGISFKQDGEKINLRNDDAPFKEQDFYKTATKKQIKRFFEDLTEWFVDEVTEKVINVHFASGEIKPAVEQVAKKDEPKQEVKQVKEPVKQEAEPVEEEVSSGELEAQLGALLGD